MGMFWLTPSFRQLMPVRFSFRKMLDEYGVRLNVLGKVEMLPESVQDSVRIAQEMTKNNNKWVIQSRLIYLLA